ncbi:flagella biosynthesis regulatory protein FliT [Erwinia persicina]|uniref:flagella biosynthesis regulatory protein FliT n=1 Tax=Erwinia persicina TaxID=55211 RepID=UPI00178065BF|nr:flagella biosynthesis regulatory protein FliT [Erwinia persicina]MBD8164606.1 flagella biosynthesis regulatory protein FliT [Erwinia persicina]
MNIAPHLLAIYQEILTHSQSMLRLAGEGQWDELIDMEVNYLSAVEKLAKTTQHQPVPAHTQEQLRPVLRHILDNESELKILLKNRQDEIAGMLQQAGRQKSVNNAYTRSAGVVLFPTGANG